MMSGLGTRIIPFNWLQPRNVAAVSESEDKPQPEGRKPHPPSIHDVLIVKAMLAKAAQFPPEIIDQIIERAEYWPHTSTHIQYNPKRTVSGHTQVLKDTPEDIFLVRTPPLGFPRYPRQTVLPEGATSAIEAEALPRPASQPFPPDVFQSLIGAKEPLLAHPCRKIVFTIVSRDQGWGGEPVDDEPYANSCTWFEAGLERWCRPSSEQSDNDDNKKPPELLLSNVCTVYPGIFGADGIYDFKFDLDAEESLKIVCNKTADDEFQEHHIEWRHTDDIDPETNTVGAVGLVAKGRGKATGNGKFVRELCVGDVVTVWAKARFPGWTNHIQSVKVDVYWAI